MSSAPPRRKSVALGIVGSAVVWEDAYREIVRRQARPVSIAGVFHPVPALAEQGARDWSGWVAPSLSHLFERKSIDAVAVFDAAWYDRYLLELAVRCRKPVLMTGPWNATSSELEPIHHAAMEAGVLIMAALPHRHSPATNRLRELMATKLGPAREVYLEMPRPTADGTRRLVEWIDWCSSVLGRPATSLEIKPALDQSDAQRLELRFPVPQLRADITLADATQKSEIPTLRIVCQHGSARILGERDIEWVVGGNIIHESLPHERTGTEIIFDQFCRRVVGGLVPVADLGDLLRCVRFAEQAAAAGPQR